MRKHTEKELKAVLEAHRRWVARGFMGDGRANLSRADLSGANLSGVDLSGVNLYGADLYRADLSGANLSRANLSGVDLSGVNLSGADLSRADLSGANLSRANLSRADLSGAKGRPSCWPAPTAVLLANWGRVSDGLCRDLMRYDAACHPDPKAFQKWADGGPCPYSDVHVGRAALFVESDDCWDPKSRLKSPYSLMQRVIAEKMGPEEVAGD